MCLLSLTQSLYIYYLLCINLEKFFMNPIPPHPPTLPLPPLLGVFLIFWLALYSHGCCWNFVCCSCWNCFPLFCKRNLCLENQIYHLSCFDLFLFNQKRLDGGHVQVFPLPFQQPWLVHDFVKKDKLICAWIRRLAKHCSSKIYIF